MRFGESGRWQEKSVKITLPKGIPHRSISENWCQTVSSYTPGLLLECNSPKRSQMNRSSAIQFFCKHHRWQTSSNEYGCVSHAFIFSHFNLRLLCTNRKINLHDVGLCLLPNQAKCCLFILTSLKQPRFILAGFVLTLSRDYSFENGCKYKLAGSDYPALPLHSVSVDFIFYDLLNPSTWFYSAMAHIKWLWIFNAHIKLNRSSFYVHLNTSEFGKGHQIQLQTHVVPSAIED